eukprot:3403662-Rhodomonas_salina.1
MLALELWAFELCAILAAYIGTVTFDAHSAVRSVSGLTYVSFPLALSIAVRCWCPSAVLYAAMPSAVLRNPQRRTHVRYGAMRCTVQGQRYGALRCTVLEHVRYWDVVW